MKHAKPTEAHHQGRTPSARKTAPTARRARGSRRMGNPRPATKSAQVLHLLQRPDGASLQELQQATGWRPHSVRGFLAGTLRKKRGLAVASTKGPDGVRRYSLPT